ncbi:uncharacterized protein [Dasypus novemcinctus]|uniref:uncharacterized protein isoform X2 n=1 Tax=Dasypus novemcinctus TaxID=9361 RepID=UPI0039C9E907
MTSRSPSWLFKLVGFSWNQGMPEVAERWRRRAHGGGPGSGLPGREGTGSRLSPSHTREVQGPRLPAVAPAERQGFTAGRRAAALGGAPGAQPRAPLAPWPSLAGARLQGLLCAASPGRGWGAWSRAAGQCGLAQPGEDVACSALNAGLCGGDSAGTPPGGRMVAPLCCPEEGVHVGEGLEARPPERSVGRTGMVTPEAAPDSGGVDPGGRGAGCGNAAAEPAQILPAPFSSPSPPSLCPSPPLSPPLSSPLPSLLPSLPFPPPSFSPSPPFLSPSPPFSPPFLYLSPSPFPSLPLPSLSPSLPSPLSPSPSPLPSRPGPPWLCAAAGRRPPPPAEPKVARQSSRKT